MPLWRVFHPDNTFTTKEERDALSADITKIYTKAGLPAFYVVVIFNAVPAEKIYVGGVSNDKAGTPFIRIVFENIARKMGSSDRKSGFLSRVDEVLKPYIADKGYDWEYHGLETDRELWKLNGLVPPGTGTEGEQLWVKENKAVPYE
ncbi:4-oxalocrotonate tautomerase [Diplodia corticola]|uniref:4-oxalocrotonate tautomerase n=1 Tax=Diplodia corticola TaxID=236234 RepID=A0A1J9RUW7_9PEZI|nr:4-oxalocrotonate tautomerase [Diplodia corticola]OJD32215.1 4-oxalocrotonate tautomerase [Diplodia corticola]